MKLLCFLSALLLSFPSSQASPQASAPPSTSSSQATTLLAQSAAALAGRVTLSDVTLSGTARRIAGSDDDTGTATFRALASGASRVDLTLSSGQRSEVENLTGTTPAGSWSGPDGVSHSIAFHNLLSEPAWFFPAFAIVRRLSKTSAAYVGQETHNGQAVQHLSVSQTPAFTDPPGAPTFEHLSQMDLFLDSTTFLPAAIAFNIHPDNNELLDIPIEIRFSDYRAVSGAHVPFHIQKYLNNTLLLDFQADSVTLNSGLSATNFQVQ